MPEQILNPGMRLLIGLIGVASFAIGALIAGLDLRDAFLGSWPLWLLVEALVCALIAVSGARLVRDAWRGRIAVRRTRFRGRAR